MLTLALKLLHWNNKNWTQRKQEVKSSFRAKWEKLVSKKQRICNKMSTVVTFWGGRKPYVKLFSQWKALPTLAENRISKCVVSFSSLKVKPLYFQTLNYHNRPCHLWDCSIPPFLPQVCLVLSRLGSSPFFFFLISDAQLRLGSTGNQLQKMLWHKRMKNSVAVMAVSVEEC